MNWLKRNKKVIDDYKESQELKKFTGISRINDNAHYFENGLEVTKEEYYTGDGRLYAGP